VLAHHRQRHIRQQPPRERGDTRVLLALAHDLHADRQPSTAMSGTVTAGANSIELGALNTKSPVGRGASGLPGKSPDRGRCC
jgi:hypothetical protein